MTRQLIDLPVTFRSNTATDTKLADLIQLTAEGDERAFGELYERMAGPVLRRATAILVDSGHAEEVTQEVFLQLWQGTAAAYDRSMNPASSWMMRLAHSRSVDRVRHVQSSRVRDGVYVRGTALVEEESLLDACIRQWDCSRVSAAFSTLSHLQQEAITLTVYRGHSFREASSLLDIPLPTLKTRVRDGLIALRPVLPAATCRPIDQPTGAVFRPPAAGGANCGRLVCQ